MPDALQELIPKKFTEHSEVLGGGVSSTRPPNWGLTYLVSGDVVAEVKEQTKQHNTEKAYPVFSQET